MGYDFQTYLQVTVVGYITHLKYYFNCWSKFKNRRLLRDMRLDKKCQPVILAREAQFWTEESPQISQDFWGPSSFYLNLVRLEAQCLSAPGQGLSSSPPTPKTQQDRISPRDSEYPPAYPAHLLVQI